MDFGRLVFIDLTTTRCTRPHVTQQVSDRDCTIRLAFMLFNDDRVYQGCVLWLVKVAQHGKDVHSLLRGAQTCMTTSQMKSSDRLTFERMQTSLLAWVSPE